MQILAHPAKRKTLAMGRRWGKSLTMGVAVSNVLRQHGRAAWVVPTYKNARPAWRAMMQYWQPLVQAKMIDVSKTDRVIQTHRGGYFAIFSEDNIDAIRGDWFHLLVNDEASKFREESRYDAIEPCVADVDGNIIDITTPRGRNWVWREYMKGRGAMDNNHASFTAPTSDNPIPAIQKAFIRARENLPDRSFRQEWMAEFIQDGGGVFRRVIESATATAQDTPQPGHDYVMGVDWAQQHDFTVITVLDATTKELIYLDRFNQIDYNVQRGRLIALYERFKPRAIVAETNSIGLPNIEALLRDGLPVQGFTTTNATKAAAVDALALAFERGDIRILNEPVLIGELQAFEMSRTKTGLRSFSAPDGMHDDTVISLALAWSGALSAVQIVKNPFYD